MLLLSVTAVVWLVFLIVFTVIVDHCLIAAAVMLGIYALIYYVGSLVNRSLIYENIFFSRRELNILYFKTVLRQ